MANISSYTNDQSLHADDKIIGTDGSPGADNGVTKNFTLSDLSEFIRGNGDIVVSGKMKVAVNDITASAGGSTTVTGSNHFNVITFTGGNGTHTITLPVVEEGVILRFKTDGTISNPKDVTLSPQSGQTIDGASTYTMDRPYDGITLLGHSSNWLVIQKKEK